MSRDPPTVSPDTVVMEAVQRMVAMGTRHLPVLADGRVVGIVAMTDLVDVVVHSVKLGRRGGVRL
jgi:CBS domain-containing protein